MYNMFVFTKKVYKYSVSPASLLSLKLEVCVRCPNYLFIYCRKILQGHRWKIHKIKGERQGRLPSYLQCQMEEPNENNIDDCDRNY